jgi:tRNA threonylcarbamoyladenosine biosynthesis protein TsaE
MTTIETQSPEETAALGEQWGRMARRGQVFALSGDLGAGKTQLVKGIARGLGVGARVHSPTFALLNEYGGGRLRLFHLDLYRLDTRAQILGAGLDEFLSDPDGVTVVEWGEKWFGPASRSALHAPALPPNFVTATIEVVSETTRRITHEHPGA